MSSISHPSVPVFLFSTLAFVSGILAFFLPEVHGEPLPDNLEDLSNLVKGTRMWSLTGKRKITSYCIENEMDGIVLMMGNIAAEEKL